MNEEQQKEYPIEQLLGEIAAKANPLHPDNGMLAALRQGLNEDTQMRAWAYLGRYCDLSDARQLMVFRLVAGAAATLQKDGLCRKGCGNVGATMRQLVTGINGAGVQADKDLASLDARFRRLLNCRTVGELCPRLVEVIRAAAAKGVPVDCAQLYWDLAKWENGSAIRMEWARGYWAGGKEA